MKNCLVVFRIFILVILLLFTGTSTSGFAEGIHIVAIVNEQVITNYDLDQAMMPFVDQLKSISDPEKKKKYRIPWTQ